MEVNNSSFNSNEEILLSWETFQLKAPGWLQWFFSERDQPGPHPSLMFIWQNEENEKQKNGQFKEITSFHRASSKFASLCACATEPPPLHYKRIEDIQLKAEGWDCSVPSESTTPYSHSRLRQVLADNWAPCRLQPQRCCHLKLITITQKLPLKTSTATWLCEFW